MTAHELLNQRKRRVMVIVYATITVQLATFLIGAAINQPFLIFYTLPVFFLGVLAAAYGAYRSFRCPWCQGNLASLVHGRGVFSFDRRFLFCPYCAHRLDEELPEAELVSAGDHSHP